MAAGNRESGNGARGLASVRACHTARTKGLRFRSAACHAARRNPTTHMSLIYTVLHPNYLAVFVVTIVSFMFGWLWYSPVLFANAWMAEMKFTGEKMQAAKPGMARMMATSFVYTLASTFAVASIITAHRSESVLKGAMYGGFLGALVVAPRLLNGGLWENRSVRLQAITVGHEVALFVMQGAIFAAWH